jgi:hypothetical protein
MRPRRTLRRRRRRAANPRKAPCPAHERRTKRERTKTDDPLDSARKAVRLMTKSRRSHASNRGPPQPAETTETAQRFAAGGPRSRTMASLAKSRTLWAEISPFAMAAQTQAGQPPERKPTRIHLAVAFSGVNRQDVLRPRRFIVTADQRMERGRQDGLPTWILVSPTQVASPKASVWARLRRNSGCWGRRPKGDAPRSGFRAGVAGCRLTPTKPACSLKLNHADGWLTELETCTVN